MRKSVTLGVVLCLSGWISAQETMTLEQCRQLAIENNKKILMAKEKVKIEKNNHQAAFTKYFPDISFAGTYQRTEKELSLLSEDAKLPIFKFNSATKQYVPDVLTVNGIPINAQGQPTSNPKEMIFNQVAVIPKEAFVMDTRNLFAGGFSLIQPVYMGGKICAYNQITKYATQIAELSLNSEIEEVVLKVDETYWQIVSLTHKHTLAKGYVDLLTQLSKDVTTLIESGVATTSDKLSVDVKLNEAQMTLLKVEDGLSLSRMLLMQQCGQPLDKQVTLADEQTVMQAAPLLVEGDINTALAQRNELKMLETGTKIYKKKESVALSAALPNIALTAGYLWTNPNLYNGFNTDFSGMWSVGVAVKVPLNFWEHCYKVKAAKGETRMAQIKLEEAKEQITMQVNQSVFKANEAAKRFVMAGVNLSKAEENLRQAQLGFSEGVTTTTNIMEAQTAWLMANSERIDAAVDLRLSEVYLKKAMGESLYVPEETKK